MVAFEGLVKNATKHDRSVSTKKNAKGMKNHKNHTLGVSPTHISSEIIICSFFMKGPPINLHEFHCSCP